MNYFGIGTFVTCVILGALSVYTASRGRMTPAIMLLVLLSLALRLYSGSDSCLHEWDERYHALVARNLLDHWLLPTLYEHPVLPYDLKNWTANHVWLHKQPLSLWLIALSLKTFGLASLAVRMPSILLSTAGILFFYDLGRRLYSERTAYLAAFFFAINGLIIELSAGRVNTDHPDIAFLFFILLSVWFVSKVRPGFVWSLSLFAGMALGAAILSKWLAALIVLPVAILQLRGVLKSWRAVILPFGLLCAAALVVAAPWQLYILSNYPAEALWEYRYNSMHLFQSLEGHGGDYLYYVNLLRIQYGEAIYLAVLCFLPIVKRNWSDYAIFIWFLLPYLFFSFTATKMPAYALIAAPAVFLINARVVIFFLEKARRANRHRVFFYVLAAALFLLPVRYTVERLKPFSFNDGNRERMEDINRLRGLVIDPTRTIIFNDPHPIETMFYLGCISYQNTPTTQQLDSLRRYFTVIIR